MGHIPVTSYATLMPYVPHVIAPYHKSHAKVIPKITLSISFVPHTTPTCCTQHSYPHTMYGTYKSHTLYNTHHTKVTPHDAPYDSHTT